MAILYKPYTQAALFPRISCRAYSDSGVTNRSHRPPYLGRTRRSSLYGSFIRSTSPIYFGASSVASRYRSAGKHCILHGKGGHPIGRVDGGQVNRHGESTSGCPGWRQTLRDAAV
jgi:hypothetical protein